MMRSTKMFAALSLGAAIAVCAADRPASAISAELAKKCRGLMLKVYPYRMPGEKKGDAAAQRDYFSKCLANDGNMPAEPPKTGQSGSGQPATPTPAK